MAGQLARGGDGKNSLVDNFTGENFSAKVPKLMAMAGQFARGGDGKNNLFDNFTNLVDNFTGNNFSGKAQNLKAMAGQLARGGDGKNNLFDNITNLVGNFTGNNFREAMAPNVMSQTLTDLVKPTKYDDTASASVLELANGDKDLQDDQIWNQGVVNSKFMSYIQPGMKINKIIPDSLIQNILNTKQNSSKGTRVGGSVAHEMNYNQGLTGEEATPNFGLDYGGFLADTLNVNGTLAKKLLSAPMSLKQMFM